MRGRTPKAGIRDQGSGIRDQGSGIRDQGSGIRDQGSGIRDQGSDESIADSDGASRGFVTFVCLIPRVEAAYGKLTP
jgi:hypothetical protein